MKRILFISFLLITNIFAQENIYFVNYGPKADKSEGDPNHFQVINFKILNNEKANLLLQIFDPDCIGENDTPIQDFNSEFRFSLYKGELLRENFTNDLKIKSSLSNRHIKSKTFAQDFEYDNKWFDFATISTDSLIDGKFSLVIFATSGNDANVFKVRILNADTKNDFNDIIIYSYQPTLRIFSNECPKSFIVDNYSSSLTLFTFDFDAAKITLNTFLNDKVLLKENNPTDWSQIPIPLNEYEINKPISINVERIGVIYNDITFYIKDENGEPIYFNFSSKLSSIPDLPEAKYNLKYETCDKLIFSTNNLSNQKYKWIFNDGSVIENFIAEKLFVEKKNYSCYLLTEKNSNSITRGILKQIDFKINELPVAVAGESKIAAPNEKIIFNASNSYDKDGYIKSYIWNFGNGDEKTGKIVEYAFSSPGKYIVKLTAIDDFTYDCNSSIDSIIVVINQKPIIKTKTEILAATNEEINFDASESYDADGNIESFIWDFQNSIFENGPIVKHSFSQPGIYYVTLKIKDNSTASNNYSEEKIKVKINFPPVPKTEQNILIGENEEATFDASKSFDKDGKIISYHWSINDVNLDGPIVKYKFDNSGKYKVKLKVTDDSETKNNSDSIYVTVIVNQRPKAIIENEKLTNEKTVLFDGSKSFDNDGKITKYIWNFGDGTTSTETKTFHTYKIPGKFIVTLKVFDNTNVSNNYSIDTSFVIINKKPIADAGQDYLISTNSSIKFSSRNALDPDGKITKVKWFINNKLISEDFNFEYKFNEPGKYIIKQEVTDDFVKPLSDLDSAIIIVNKPPKAKIKCVTKAIPNQKIKFDASDSFDEDGNIINYTWIIDNKIKLIGKQIDYQFEKSGIYKIILQVEDNSNVENSISTDTVYVKINHSPIINVANEIFTCEKFINFDASASSDPDGDDILFTWKFHDSDQIFFGSKISHQFKESGVFPVLLTLNDKQDLPNSIVKKTLIVKIHQHPIANAGRDTIVCTEDLIIFNGLYSKSFDNSVLSYEWIFDDSTKYYGSNIVKVFNKAGIYNVILKVTDDSNLPCNFSYDSKIIKVIDTPHANAGEDINACVGIPVKFDGTNSTDIDGIVNSFTWDFGDGETGAGATPNHIYDKPRNYKVVLTITGDSKGGCGNVSRDELIVKVFDGPIASFTFNDSTDENTKIVFDATKSTTPVGKIISYNWDFGDGSTAQGKIVEHSFNKYGNYIVTLTIRTDINSFCNSASSSGSVYINKNPIANIIAPNTGYIYENILFDASTSFDPNGKISKYIWDFGDGTTDEGIKVFHSFSNAKNYKVSLKVIDDTNTSKNFSSIETNINIINRDF